MEENQKALLSQQYSNYFANKFDANDLNSVLSVVELQSSMLKSLADMYVVMYLVNLETDTFVEIACMDHVKKLFGNLRSTKAVLQLVIDNFVAPEFREEATVFNDMDTLAERLKDKKVISMDYNATIAGWCRQQFIAVSWDENGLAKEALCIEQRIQAEKMKLDNLRHLAETDGLTQLINRTSGAAYINKYLAEGRLGMFALFDVNQFKHFNDQYGHAAGDEILRVISACMKETFRGEDVLLRLGGDEFVIYAPGLLDKKAGSIKIQDFCANIAKKSFTHFHEAVTVSVGVVFGNDGHYHDFEELLQSADALMYENKKHFHNAQQS